MSNDCLLYGYIRAHGGTIDEVIGSLPPSDDYPPLARPMVHATGHDSRTGAFDGSRVILVGGTFNHIQEAIDEWLDKFEPLLDKLHWYDAMININLGWMGQPLKLHYQVVHERRPEGQPFVPPTLPLRWTLRCSGRNGERYEDSPVLDMIRKRRGYTP